MNDETQQIDSEKIKELVNLRVVLSVPGTQDIQVRRNIPYKSGVDQESGIDVYLPPGASDALPAVIFVSGYSDQWALDFAGLKLKDWGSYVSWGQLVAASGLVGITYSCDEPPRDANEVLQYVRENSAALRIDPERIGIWAASGNGPTALSLLTDPQTRLRFAVMSNTYMLDLDGDTTVADMAAQIGFAAPNSDMSVSDLNPNMPMFVVRSGKDEGPGLNQTIDRFVKHAIESDLPLRFANLPDAPHGYDTLHDTEESRETIRQILAFMRASSEMEI